jgi:hypothetical protein
MSKRNKAFKNVNRVLKAKYIFPMAFCLNENKPIAVSKVKCIHGKPVKVSKEHWTDGNGKFLKGYEFDLSKAKVGDKILCPKCGKPLDFRMWMSDVEPDIK